MNGGLTLDGVGKLISGSAGSNPDAISNTLTTVNGYLTLQDGANLTLHSASFNNTGTGEVDVLSGSKLDLTNVDFTANVTSGGLLTGGGLFVVGANSTLVYGGASGNINTIDTGTGLVLQGAVFNRTGQVLNGTTDALAGSLATVNGYLGLDHGAYVGLGQALTNTGTVDLTGGGNTLRAQGFTNSGLLATINVGSQDTADFRTGSIDPTTFANYSGGTLSGGVYNIAGSFLYDGNSVTRAGAINAISGAVVYMSGNGSMGYGGSGTDALAGISSVSGGTLALGGLAFDGMSSPYTITPTTGTLAIAARDTDSPSPSPSTAVQFAALNGTNLTVAGNLTNTASVTSGGQVYSGVGVGGASLTINGNLTNTAILSTASGADSATAEVDVTAAQMNVNGNFLNQVQQAGGSSGSAAALVRVIASNDGSPSDLNVTGTFGNSGGGSLYLSNGATAEVGGLFTNGTGSQVSVVNGHSLFSSMLTTNGGLTNGGDIILRGATLNNTGLLTNSGTMEVNDGATLTSAGDVTNTGGVTTGGFGGNVVEVTGTLFNTSPGVLNLNGVGDHVTASAQFTNSGTVNMNGDYGLVQAFHGFDNQVGGLVVMAGDHDIFEAHGGCLCSISPVDPFGKLAGGFGGAPLATGSNEGTFQVTGTNGQIITDGDFTNSGTVTLSGTGNSLTVSSGTYTQTGGTTEVDTGNTLQAATIDINGGTVTGGGTLIGDVTNSGTINPGDPVSLFITGMFTQTSAGILNMDLASDTSFDQINVTGNVNLDGTLDLTLDPGFTASIGTIFDILHWTGVVTGDFVTFNNVVTSGGWQYTFTELAVGSNELDIQLVGASQTPEPSTFAMLFGGLLAGAGVHWRRRKKNVGRS